MEGFNCSKLKTFVVKESFLIRTRWNDPCGCTELNDCQTLFFIIVLAAPVILWIFCHKQNICVLISESGHHVALV